MPCLLIQASQTFQPTAQRPRSIAVVGIVENDRFTYGLVNLRHFAQFKAMLHLPRSLAGGIQCNLPLKAMKYLKRLERILLHACPDGSFHNRMKIDEQTRPQHPVDFFFTRRVASHEPLKKKSTGC